MKIKPIISVSIFKKTLKVCNFLNLDSPSTPISLAALITGIINLLIILSKIIAITMLTSIKLMALIPKIRAMNPNIIPKM